MDEQGMNQNGWIENPEFSEKKTSLNALDAKITNLFPGVQSS